MSSRYWWVDVGNSNAPAQFKWTPCSIKMDFRNLTDSKGTRKMIVNHFENHKEITRKDDLIRNLTAFSI